METSLIRERVSAYCDKFIFWGIFLIASVVPLAMNPWAHVVNEPTKLFVLRFLSVAIVSAWGVKILAEGRLRLRRTPLDIPLLIFLAIAGTAVLFSISPRISFYGRLYRFEGFLTILSYVLIYYAAVNFVRSKKSVNLLLLALLGSAFFVAVYGSLQYLGLDFMRWETAYTDVSRSFSTFGNADFYGAYLTLVLPIALALSVAWLTKAQQNSSGSNKTLLWVFLLGGLTVLLLVNLLATSSRGAWLGFLVSLLFMGMVLRREIHVNKMIVAVLVSVLLVAAAVYYFAPLLSQERFGRHSVGERLLSLVQPGKGSAADRLMLWKVTIRMIRERPALGFGPDTYHLVFPGFRPFDWYKVVNENAMPDRAHNDFLQTAESTGLAGLAAYLWVLLIILGRGTLFIRRSTEPAVRVLAVGLLGALIGYLVQVAFSFSIFSVAPVFWLASGLLVSLMLEEEAENPRMVDVGLGRVQVSEGIVVVAILVACFLLVLATVRGIRPVLAEMHLKRGMIYQRANLWDKAVLELEKAIALNPSEDEYRIQLAEAYRSKFIRSQSAYDGKQAADILNRALELNSLNEKTYYLLGNLYQIAGQVVDTRMLQQADFAFSKALELDPNNPGFHYELGVVYVLRREFEGAVKFFEKAVELNPEFSEAYYGLGTSYRYMNEKDKARQAFKNVLRLDPQFDAAKTALDRLEQSMTKSGTSSP